MKLRSVCCGLLVGAVGIAGSVALAEHQLGSYSAQNLGRISQPAKHESPKVQGGPRRRFIAAAAIRHGTSRCSRHCLRRRGMQKCKKW